MTTRNGRQSLDANAVVSYNLRAIRCRRGWTQQAVAERLGRLAGHQLPQASISAMEGSFAGRRRRRFDAHELYLLAEVFAVPIAYFFLPPPQHLTPGQVLADTARPPIALYAAFLGAGDELAAVDERLAEAAGEPGCAEEVIGALYGPAAAGSSWPEHYRAWRDRRLHQLGGQWGERLAAAAAVLSGFVGELRALRPEAFLDAQLERSNDTAPSMHPRLAEPAPTVSGASRRSGGADAEDTRGEREPTDDPG